jgi:hypothetical protein
VTGAGQRESKFRRRDRFACRYDSITGMCVDEFGDEQKCGDAIDTR